MSFIISIALLIFGFFLLKILWPLITKILLYMILAIPLWVILFYIPSFIEEIVLLIVLIILAFKKVYLDDRYYGTGYYTDDNRYYRVNKKSGVIHDIFSSDYYNISEKHRKDVTYSEATDMINNHKRYRFRK